MFSDLVGGIPRRSDFNLKFAIGGVLKKTCVDWFWDEFYINVLPDPNGMRNMAKAKR